MRVRVAVSCCLYVAAALLLYAVAACFPSFAAGAVVVVGSLICLALGLRVEPSRRRDRERVGVRINTIVRGEPADWLLDWKRRGLVRSNADAVIQALRALHEKITQLDLKIVRLRNYRRVEEE